jgi:hypothetical protein
VGFLFFVILHAILAALQNDRKCLVFLLIRDVDVLFFGEENFISHNFFDDCG